MPVSPFQHGTNEGSEPKGSSAKSRRKKSGKPKSKPTTAHRNNRKNVKDRYAHAREDAQLLGLIPTTPEDALKPEKVDPAQQGEQSLTGIVREAIRRGWAVPEGIKPQLVDELVAILQDPSTSAKEKVASFSALVKADWNQYRQDHPERDEAIGPFVLNITEIVVDALDARNIDAIDRQDNQNLLEAAPIPPQ